MTDDTFAGLLEARNRMAFALEKLEMAIRDLESVLPDQCPACHDCGQMADRATGFIVPCACREHGYDEQRAARGN